VLEIAAAGGHSLLMVGPPGSGKSMLAQRLPGLLPPMDDDEALQSAALQGLSAQGFDPAEFGRRPLRAPHHSASAVALVGGGSPPKPGEISLAHGGVLFLDELVEFDRRTLEALREPLEASRITISHAARQATFPARFQLVAAMNPCPCGWLGATAATGRHCRCSSDAVARYQGRRSGPLLDRIDLQVEVPAVPPGELLTPVDSEASATVAARGARARDRARSRQQRPNGELDAAGVLAHCRLDDAAERFARQAAQRLGWSARSLHRMLKVARTIADPAGRDGIAVADVAEAMQYRRGLAAP
jgi:magnesium chelatase family protein